MPQSRQDGRQRRVTADTVLEFMRVLWAMDHELQRASKRLTRDLGITGPQRLALRTIARAPGLSPQDVAAALYLHKSTVSGILKRLEDQRLLYRAVDPSDKRRARLHLTAQGESLSNSKGPTIERAVQHVLADRPEHSVDAARLLLTAIAAQLQQATERQSRRERGEARIPA
jgi:DNA-binding MarR family transcriptional regulator